jgi:uncharacterized membrane protein (DUF4010 family)
MVVLVVGIGLGGDIGYKFFGAKAGLLLAGVLGGIISSTATTVTYSKRAAKQELADNAAALVILLASTVSCGLVHSAGTAFDCGDHAGSPIFVLGSSIARTVTRCRPKGNPSELKGALYFALRYAVILVAIAAVKD